MSKRFIAYEEQDNLNKYFKDIRKSCTLSPEEEVELAKKIKNGDESAIEKLVNANLKFVITIAKEYQGQGLSLNDLISEGNLGLVKAAKRFDHTRGFRFISYAVYWIRQSIMQSLTDNSRIIRLPSNVVTKLQKNRKLIEKFEHDNHRPPLYGDEIIGCDESVEVFKNDYKIPTCTSLNNIINDDGDELIGMVSGTNTEEIYNIDDDEKRVKEILYKTLEILDDRERNILECYFGLNENMTEMTLEAIGDKYDLTKERIRQIKERAIRKLRNNAGPLYNFING